MPANLTPEYEKAERRYRQATNDEERLAGLQEMFSAIPKHKGTEKMQADLKHRISQLRQQEQKTAHTKGPDPFHIPKGGAGQVVLIGPPNTGKSSLLAATTHASVKVAEYPFTTVLPQPGMWHKDDVHIELVDTPPLTPEHVPTGLLGTIRNADVVCAVVEAGEAALDQAEMVLGVCSSRGLTLRTLPRNQLSPANPNQRPGLIVTTKADLVPPGAILPLRELYASQLEVLALSTRSRQGLDDWFQRLWTLLAMIRVYSKEPGRPPDLHKPFIVPAGATVAELARQIHRDLPERMKFARLWGHSRFEGQQVHKTEPLRDRDVVEIHE
ncbi:MAG TPA: 50S ribosome-binding GTPase [Verrucomicrobiota bacterium]|jgi:ribosome-interacting GTPase 1|nr:50S ribosome-binding GTPase [Verrucomicrobiota bacterium]HQL76888.1 50S ribosome-binding GTPase [Verrucomicrobiota bacterium]